MDIALARSWVQAIATAVEEHKDHLTQLDSAIGDADHGANMHRGFSAVTEVLAGLEPGDGGEVLVKTGTTLVSKVGGASGPLYGSVFRSIGKSLTATGKDAAATSGTDASGTAGAEVRRLAEALAAGLESLQKLGAASPGDKTMVDAYAPALEAFTRTAEAGGDLAAASRAAADAAEEGMRATTPLQARKGRASYLGPRSVGHQDPGATSTALVFRALAEAVTNP